MPAHPPGGTPWNTPHGGPQVSVRHPDEDRIELVLRPGADVSDVGAVLATLPPDAVHTDHYHDPDAVALVFRRFPEPHSGTSRPVPPGWTPSLLPAEYDQNRREDPYRQAVRTVAAGLVLGVFDPDVVASRPGDPAAPTVMTVVAFVRRRADTLAARSGHRTRLRTRTARHAEDS